MGREVAVTGAVRIIDGRGAIDFLRPLLPPSGDTETLICTFLDAGGRVLDHMTQAGDAGAVELPIRRMIARALMVDAAALLLAHNHPSGNPTPSAGDVELTRRVARALRPLGIELHDHLIRAGEEWRSMSAMGML